MKRCLTHQRLGALFGGWLKLSDIGRGFLLDGVSPLGGLTPLWLRCGGNGQEHGGSWCSLREEVKEKRIKQLNWKDPIYWICRAQELLIINSNKKVKPQEYIAVSVWLH